MASTNSSNPNTNDHGDERLASQTNRARSETAISAGGAPARGQQSPFPPLSQSREDVPDPDEPLNREQRLAARARAAEAGRTFQMAMGLSEEEREMVRREGENTRLRAARRSGGQDSAVDSGMGDFGSAMRGDVGGAGGGVSGVGRGGFGGMMGGGERGGVGGIGGHVRGRGIGRGGRHEHATVGWQIVDLTQDDDEMDVDESG